MLCGYLTTNFTSTFTHMLRKLLSVWKEEAAVYFKTLFSIREAVLGKKIEILTSDFRMKSHSLTFLFSFSVTNVPCKSMEINCQSLKTWTTRGSYRPDSETESFGRERNFYFDHCNTSWKWLPLKIRSHLDVMAYFTTRVNDLSLKFIVRSKKILQQCT